MSVSAKLGEAREVRLAQGTIRYRERGEGEPIVFVHGAFVNGDLWRDVVGALGDGYRCITPDLPLGAHRDALAADADVSPAGVARLIADFLAALDLHDVTIVGNDTGGALSQGVVTRHPERIGRLVLTNCDAFDNFPPRGVKVAARLLGRAPGALALMVLLGRSTTGMRLLVKTAAKRTPPPDVLRGYAAGLRSAGVRRDTAKLLRGARPEFTREAAERLPGFDRPALVAWGTDDWFFPVAHARRLAELLPQGRLELIPDARTFPSEDQPERLAELIAAFVADTEARAAQPAAAAG